MLSDSQLKAEIKALEKKKAQEHTESDDSDREDEKNPEPGPEKTKPKTVDLTEQVVLPRWWKDKWMVGDKPFAGEQGEQRLGLLWEMLLLWKETCVTRYFGHKPNVLGVEHSDLRTELLANPIVGSADGRNAVFEWFMAYGDYGRCLKYRGALLKPGELYNRESVQFNFLAIVIKNWADAVQADFEETKFVWRGTGGSKKRLNDWPVQPKFQIYFLVVVDLFFSKELKGYQFENFAAPSTSDRTRASPAENPTAVGEPREALC